MINAAIMAGILNKKFILFDRKTRLGFTMVELVMSIVIISILSVVSIPKFGGSVAQAKANVDNQVIAQLNIAIKSKYLENIGNGLDPSNAWPTQHNLFALMVQAPPCQVDVGTFAKNSNDGVNWRIVAEPSGNLYIFCPHCTAGWNGTTPITASLPGNFDGSEYASDEILSPFVSYAYAVVVPVDFKGFYYYYNINTGDLALDGNMPH